MTSRTCSVKDRTAPIRSACSAAGPVRSSGSSIMCANIDALYTLGNVITLDPYSPSITVVITVALYPLAHALIVCAVMSTGFPFPSTTPLSYHINGVGGNVILVTL